MSDDFNLDIIQNDDELKKVCFDSVELIKYARNVVVKHVNIVQIMTYYSVADGLWKRNKWEKRGQSTEVRLLKHYQKIFRKSLVKDFQKIH